MSGEREAKEMRSGWDAWLEGVLEDESWRSGLTDDQAERLLRWALARLGPHPEETGGILRRAMRRIRRAVQASEEEARALLAEWGLHVPPGWKNWTVEDRLVWVLEALAPWQP